MLIVPFQPDEVDYLGVFGKQSLIEAGGHAVVGRGISIFLEVLLLPLIIGRNTELVVQDGPRAGCDTRTSTII